MTRPRIDFDEFKIAVLISMYEAFLADRPRALSSSQIAEGLKSIYPSNAVGLILSELSDLDYVGSTPIEYSYGPNPDRHNGPDYMLTTAAIDTLSGIKDSEYQRLSGKYLDEGYDFERSQETPIPASDRIVTPNDNQRTEAKKTLEGIVKEFREDHHFDNEWGSEKKALIKALEYGLEYLESKALNVRIGTMLILEPLQEIAAKYEREVKTGVIVGLIVEALKMFAAMFAG